MKHLLSRSLFVSLSLLAGVLLASPAAAQPVGAYEVSAESGLNVRSGPSADAARVGRLAPGASVEVLAVAGSWAKIRFEGAERYVHGDYLRPAGERISTTRTAYALRGQDTRRGEYDLRLTLQRHPNVGIEVVREARYSDGRLELHRGMGRFSDGQLQVRLDEKIGASGALEGVPASGAIALAARFGQGGAIEVADRSPRGEGRASGRSEASSEGSTGSGSSGGGQIVQRGKHLLAVADREVGARIRRAGARLAYNGAALEQEFALSRFFHVGVGGALKALEPSELSPAQAETTRERPGHVWLESLVHGGVRVPLSTTIPVGELSFGVGFETGARVDYTVVDLYPLPAGVTDLRTMLADLRQVKSRSFDLPLDAAEARAMNVGARRIFEGRAHVALSGNFMLGREVADVRDVLRIGASARVGGFYKISGRARVEVERLARGRVRVRLSRAREHQRGTSADLFLGASLDHAAVQQELAPVVEYVDEALINTNRLSPELRAILLGVGQAVAINQADRVVKRALRFRIQASATSTREDEFDLAYRFDLERAPAREAYERAVRGDFTLAGKRALDPASGVSMDHRVLDVENTTHLAASLELSVFLNVAASRRISIQDLSVDDETGRTDYEVWRYEREFKLELFDQERRRRVDMEVIRRTRPSAGANQSLSRSLRFRLDVTDPSTRAAEAASFRRLLASWGLDHSSNLPRPESRGLLASRYGKTRTQLEIQIGDHGIEHILRHSAPTYLDAYARAYSTIEGRVPLWSTEQGRRRIDSAQNDDGNNFQHERNQLDRARRFARSMEQLGQARTPQARAQALKWIATSARYDLYSVAALVSLAPRDSLSIDASLLGERIRVVDGVRGASALAVADPR